MHVFEDLLFIEVVDDQYQPVAPGVYGSKVLVTTLFSRTQPLIRYELNDSVRQATDPCTCSLPFAVIDGIHGRVEDTLSLPSMTGGRVKRVAQYLDNEPFMLTYGDGVSEIDIRRLVEIANKE